MIARVATAANRAPMPLAAYLSRLIWLCLLPLLLLAVWLAVDSVRTLRSELDEQANYVARQAVAAIDQRLRTRKGALQVMATSPLLDSDERLRDFYTEAQGYQHRFGSHVILADVGEPMRMLLHTREPFSRPLPPLPKPPGQAAAPAAVASGAPAVGDIVFGPLSGEPLVAIAVPVMRKERAVFVLLTIIEARQFQTRLDEMALLAGWTLTLVDSRGDVIARRAPPGTTPTPDAIGRQVVVASAESPWSLVLDIPHTAYRAPVIKAAVAVAGAVLLATLISFLGGMLASRRLARSVAQLADPTAAGPTLRIAEIAAVRQRLAETEAGRLAAEAIRHDSEARFQVTFEQAAVGIALLAPDGRWLRVNRKLCEFLGYSQDELLTRSFQDVTFPDDLAGDVKQMQRLLAGEIASYALEKRYLRKDGGSVWGRLSVALLRKADGTPDYFVSVVEDIQARKDAERALATARAATSAEREQARLAALNQMEDAIAARASAEQANAALSESREQLQLFIEHAPAALAMFDRDMRYLACSRRWCDDYALSGRELIGESHYAVFPDIPERWQAVHRRALAGEIVRADEDRFDRDDGSIIWLRWEVRPWHRSDGGVGGIVVFSEDITRFKEAEDAVRELNTSLEQRVSERTAELTIANQELDSFAYAVSHDLRAPLRALTGFSQALLEDHGGELQGDARDCLDQIGIATRKMGELIDAILALSRSTRGELRSDTVDLSALAASIGADLAAAEPDRRVDLEIEPGLVVCGDARMVEVVLRNLLGNAWKYTARTPAAAIRVYAGHVAGLAGVCVADNGAGFNMAHADQLFQPFRRLHRYEEFPGIGIGLATVQRIVRRHGGEIRAEAVPREGARFCFTLAGHEKKIGGAQP